MVEWPGSEIPSLRWGFDRPYREEGCASRILVVWISVDVTDVVMLDVIVDGTHVGIA